MTKKVAGGVPASHTTQIQYVVCMLRGCVLGLQQVTTEHCWWVACDAHTGWHTSCCKEPALCSSQARTHKQPQRLRAVGAPHACRSVGAAGRKVVGRKVGAGRHVPHCTWKGEHADDARIHPSIASAAAAQQAISSGRVAAVHAAGQLCSRLLVVACGIQVAPAPTWQHVAAVDRQVGLHLSAPQPAEGAGAGASAMCANAISLPGAGRRTHLWLLMHQPFLKQAAPPKSRAHSRPFSWPPAEPSIGMPQADHACIWPTSSPNCAVIRRAE